MRAFLRRSVAELLVSCACIAGWALITCAVAQLWRPSVVWSFSAGLFLLSLCGFAFLFKIAREGLYTLTKAESNG